MNAGDLGSSLAVCACAYDPTHVTAQGPSLRQHCACVPTLHRVQTSRERVLFPMGSREFYAHIMGIKNVIWSHGLYADWSRPILLRSDWLLLS